MRSARNIKLKVPIDKQNQTPKDHLVHLLPNAEKFNRDYWQQHMPQDAICFAFALEGGVVQAHDTGYLAGRWITIRRDGALYMHPLSAGFGPYGDNDLGGSVEGPGTIASMNDIREFAISVFSDQSYWEYVMAHDS